MIEKSDGSPRQSRGTTDTQETRPVLIRRIGRDGQVIPWRPKGQEAEEDPKILGIEIEGQPIEEEWEIQVEFAEVAGRLYPSRVVLEEGHFAQGLPPGGITARLFHAIKLGAIIDEFRQELQGDRDAEAILLGRTLTPAYELPPPTNRPGPKGLGEDVYIDVALDYLEAFRANPRAPIEQMLPRYPLRPKGNVRDWVARARHKGYLTSVRRGVPGAEPTKKLMEAIRAREEAPVRGRRSGKAQVKRQTTEGTR
jgi:hypothetical protein